MIKDLATTHEVADVCELLEVSTSGYYAWVGRKPGKRQMANQALAEQIQHEHAVSRKTYGSPRILKMLRRKGVKCGRKRVARLMKQKGLKGAQKARFRPRTTDSRHDLPISPNRLAELPAVERVNQVWVSDITYIPTLEGWMYLAAFMDLKSRKIKGWTMRDHLRTELVESAFRQTVFREGSVPGLIVHSDRGSQYASACYRQLLTDYRMMQSMSRRANCWDNAPMESFFGTLKSELVHHRLYRTRDEASPDVFYYIEGFYNRRRLHSSLGYVSPEAYEQLYHKQHDRCLTPCPQN